MHLLRYVLFGQGEVPPVTREILRRVERDVTPEPAATRTGALLRQR
jgi:hypothetical protein